MSPFPSTSLLSSLTLFLFTPPSFSFSSFPFHAFLLFTSLPHPSSPFHSLSHLISLLSHFHLPRFILFLFSSLSLPILSLISFLLFLLSLIFSLLFLLSHFYLPPFIICSLLYLSHEHISPSIPFHLFSFFFAQFYLLFLPSLHSSFEFRPP